MLGVGFVGAVLVLGFSDDIVPVTSKHGVSFTTASLSVGENGDIVAGNNFLKDGFDTIEDVPLSAGCTKDSLKVLFSDLA